MRIEVITDSPQHLVDGINKAILYQVVQTWNTVENENQEIVYTHTAGQWEGTALLKPVIYRNKVAFRVTWGAQNAEPRRDVKGYILGRFIEMLLVHFPRFYSKLETYD